MIALTFGLLVAVLLPAQAATADADDFSYSSWESTYMVSIGENGRPIANVTETLVAEFPDHDQNKGIVRGYPQRYQGAGLSIQILSVKDDRGRDVPYETETDDGMLLVLTGDDEYVHGNRTYVIKSVMRDFMIHGTRSGNDEFFWNLLPLNSTQDIGAFRAQIAFAPPLSAHLTGDVACYRGFAGERKRCTIERPAAPGGMATFTVASGKRAAGDGVTVAIGFTAGTITQPAARLPDPVADFGPTALAAGSIAAAGGAWVCVAAFIRRRRTATGIIVAQFDVPADLPPLAAAALIPRAPNPVPAQLVHLAVQGVARLEEEQGAKARPVLRLVDRTRARDDLDQAIVQVLFPAHETVCRIPRSSKKFAARMTRLVAKGRTAAADRGWTTSARSRSASVLGLISVVLVVGSIAVAVWSASKDRDMSGFTALAACVAVASLIVTMIVAFSNHTVPTPEGARQLEHLLGVKEFIRVAEADRMRMLQSYQGAERRPDGAVDVVHLYEKLLPYAMLLGEEKSWTRVLETTYSAENAHPTWMNVAIGVSIGSRLGPYSSSVNAAATYSPASSGGGSTGGGFSGGGGGGGFSGGR